MGSIRTNDFCLVGELIVYYNKYSNDDEYSNDHKTMCAGILTRRLFKIGKLCRVQSYATQSDQITTN